MTLQEYLAFTETVVVYPRDREDEYLHLGLTEEVGEVAGLLKREIRDGVPVDRDKMLKELGDVLFYLVRLNRCEVDIQYLISSINQGIKAHAYWGMDIEQDIMEDIKNPVHYGYFIASHGFTLDEIIDANVAKLSRRKEEGKLHGQGSDR